MSRGYGSGRMVSRGHGDFMEIMRLCAALGLIGKVQPGVDLDLESLITYN